MFSYGKKYGKLFFKLLLLAVYFAFFAVQLFLRYSSSNSQQSLEGYNYRKSVANKKDFTKIFISKSDDKKDKHLSYLNKRFHPQDAVVVPSYSFQLLCFYSKLATKFIYVQKHFAEIKINSASLRGPPSFS